MINTALSDLLELQLVDSEIDRLLERRQGLDQLRLYREIHEQIVEVETERNQASEALKQLERDLDKADGELEILEAKVTEHETRLFAGGMSGKETEYMRLEVQSLKGQRDAMESRVLQMLEAIEPAREEVKVLDQRLGELNVVKSGLDEEIRAEWKVIDAAIGKQEALKQAAVAPISPELLEMYDKLRRIKEGVAIASFEHGVCGGCHLTLSPAESEEAFADEIPRCVHCRRILVA